MAQPRPLGMAAGRYAHIEYVTLGMSAPSVLIATVAIWLLESKKIYSSDCEYVGVPSTTALVPTLAVHVVPPL